MSFSNFMGFISSSTDLNVLSFSFTISLHFAVARLTHHLLHIHIEKQTRVDFLSSIGCGGGGKPCDAGGGNDLMDRIIRQEGKKEGVQRKGKGTWK